MQKWLLPVLLLLTGSALAAPAPIKIGELDEYTKLPLYAQGCKNGWQMALEEINASGGVLGRPLEVISRDSKGTPASAITVAEELTQQEHVSVLMGTMFDNIGLAVGEYAGKNHIALLKFLDGTDAHVWQHGNKYSFRSGITNYLVAAALADEAAKLPAKRWATVAPNYEFGHSFVESFEKALKQRRPDVEFAASYWPEILKIDAATVTGALQRAKPDAILNVLFSSDAVQFYREGMKRHLFDSRPVVASIQGWPEELKTSGAQTPQGWLAYGWPADQIPAAQGFVKKYTAKYGEMPGYAAFQGYNAMKFVAAAIKKAGSDDREKIAVALKGVTIESPVGKLTMRAIDNQPDMGVWVGKTKVENGIAKLDGVVFKPAQDYLPSDAVVKTLRPQE